MNGTVDVEQPRVRLALAAANFVIEHAGRKPSALELQLYEDRLNRELEELTDASSS